MKMTPIEETKMAASLTDLAATAAMRHEDMRIARKHYREAEDRNAQNATPANQYALTGAKEWAAECTRRYFTALREWNREAEKAARRANKPNMAKVRKAMGV